MLEILTAEQMKKADLKAIADGIPAIELIDTAARGLAKIIEDNYAPAPILFLNGPGNNGADGFIAADYLKKAGWDVRCACTVKRGELKNDAKVSVERWQGDIEPLNSNLGLKNAAIVVDCIYGTGYSGALPAEIVTLFDKIRMRKLQVVAADVPSGLNATTGISSPGTLKADITVAFCRKKIAHVTLPSKEICGKIRVAEVQIPDATISAMGSTVFENDPALWLKDFPIPGAGTHKFERGHAVVYGGTDKTGAARLGAAAAQRAGAGLVSITTRPETKQVYELYRASIMAEAWSTAEEFRTLLRDERKNAVLIGPGAGADDKLRDAVRATLDFNKAAVLDADVFTAFKDNAKELFSRLSPELHVLTPHEGEFERMFGKLDGSKLERACKAAKLSNAIIVLKGSDTIIAAPDGTAVINTNAPSTLATAGSGDVLAGLITGLMAQGMKPFMAAAAGVWLHSETARNLGLGMAAEDIISHTPQTLNRLFRLG
ncbi:MAG: NAD(P)H-hydrate dehydratase [Micavibrio sp.]|nr:NAD(P)H-hydrate dehydratase [Micavibrio sp.]